MLFYFILSHDRYCYVMTSGKKSFNKKRDLDKKLAQTHSPIILASKRLKVTP